MDFWKLLTSALAIAVGLLIYERYFKTSVSSNSENTGSKTVQQEVEAIIAKEAL